jgi:hypothetical protein
MNSSGEGSVFAILIVANACSGHPAQAIGLEHNQVLGYVAEFIIFCS